MVQPTPPNTNPQPQRSLLRAAHLPCWALPGATPGVKAFLVSAQQPVPKTLHSFGIPTLAQLGGHNRLSQLQLLNPCRPAELKSHLFWIPRVPDQDPSSPPCTCCAQPKAPRECGKFPVPMSPCAPAGPISPGLSTRRPTEVTLSHHLHPTVGRIFLKSFFTNRRAKLDLPTEPLPRRTSLNTRGWPGMAPEQGAPTACAMPCKETQCLKEVNV